MFWPRGLLDETWILWAPHRPWRGDTVAGERPFQRGAGSQSPLAAHAWKLYAGIPSLSVVKHSG